MDDDDDLAAFDQFRKSQVQPFIQARLESLTGKKNTRDVDSTFGTVVEKREESSFHYGGSGSIPYEKLTGKVSGIDISKKENYLSDAEFMKHLGCTREVFVKYPEWKKNDLKRKANLF